MTNDQASDQRSDLSSLGSESDEDFGSDDNDWLAKPTERSEVSSTKSAIKGLVEWVVIIVGAVVVALLLKTFLVAAFWIPSGSMESTLEVKDRVFVNKLSYKSGDISRGDIVVIHRDDVPPGGTEDLIKRVIGLPGETIEVSDSTVFIDGEPLDESDYLEEGLVYSDEAPVTVEDGHVFLMGDNRGNSADSRIPPNLGGLGPVPEDQVVGRAFVRFWPLNRLGGL